MLFNWRKPWMARGQRQRLAGYLWGFFMRRRESVFILAVISCLIVILDWMLVTHTHAHRAQRDLRDSSCLVVWALVLAFPDDQHHIYIVHSHVISSGKNHTFNSFKPSASSQLKLNICTCEKENTYILILNTLSSFSFLWEYYKQEMFVLQL